MNRLKKRAEFVEVAKGARLHSGAFSLQAKRRRDPSGVPRIGFTVTKKTGNAVERNRIRRRLKAAVCDVAGSAAEGIDYVLIGRREALSATFDSLCDTMRRAFRTIDPDRRSKSAAPRARTVTQGDKRDRQ